MTVTCLLGDKKKKKKERNCFMGATDPFFPFRDF